jgi:hypothetical protein
MIPQKPEPADIEKSESAQKEKISWERRGAPEFP